MAPPAEEAQEPAADLPPPVPDGDPTQTPLDFLLAVMRNSKMPMQMRMNAAVNCAPYVHVKKGEAGKKEGAAAKAKETAKGTFRPSAPPQLRKVA